MRRAPLKRTRVAMSVGANGLSDKDHDAAAVHLSDGVHHVLDVMVTMCTHSSLCTCGFSFTKELASPNASLTIRLEQNARVRAAQHSSTTVGRAFRVPASMAAA